MKQLLIYFYMLLLFFSVTIKNSSLQASDSLQFYLKLAVENNPKVQSEFLAYQASLQRISQMGAWEDPQLELGVWTEPMHIVGGKNVANIKLMQMFPWFGTQKAARSEARYMAQMAFEKYVETKANIYWQVYSQWYTLCALQSRLNNLLENKNLLIQIENVAKRNFATPGFSPVQSDQMQMERTTNTPSKEMSASSMSGMEMTNRTEPTPTRRTTDMSKMNMNMSTSPSSGGLSAVLQIQIEIAEIENLIVDTENLLQVEVFKFNTLLNRDGDDRVVIPDSLTKVSFLYERENILHQIESKNPMLKMIKQQKMSYVAQEKMAKKMSYPMWGIGVEYMINKQEHNSMGSMSNMNGKNMIMPMISMTIPIYRSKYKAQQKESRLMQESAYKLYEDTQNSLKSEAHAILFRLEEVARKISLYEKQLLLTQKLYDLALRELAVGTTDLSKIIQIGRQIADYKQKKTDEVASYNTLVASIKKMIYVNEDIK